MDLDHNQIMICVIYHHDSIGLEILAMCTRCKKRLITYHKNNGITSMKKHVEANHFALMKNLVEDPNIALVKTPLGPLYFHLQILIFLLLKGNF
jgi:hypothetical protein